MDTKTLAALLLIGHLVATVLMLLVFYRQIKILRQRPDPELRSGRLALFILAVAILGANFIPMAIDVLVIFGEVGRNRPSGAGIAYALSNVLSLVFSAGALYALYVIAERLVNKGRR